MTSFQRGSRNEAEKNDTDLGNPHLSARQGGRKKRKVHRRTFHENNTKRNLENIFSRAKDKKKGKFNGSGRKISLDTTREGKK